jgi:hypothetical protein
MQGDEFAGEFYSEEIEARFEKEPLLEKRPGLPSGFIWRGREYHVVELRREWHDYRKRGKSAAFYEKERGAYWVQASQRRGGAPGAWAAITIAF